MHTAMGRLGEGKDTYADTPWDFLSSSRLAGTALLNSCSGKVISSSRNATELCRCPHVDPSRHNNIINDPIQPSHDAWRAARASKCATATVRGTCVFQKGLWPSMRRQPPASPPNHDVHDRLWHPLWSDGSHGVGSQTHTHTHTRIHSHAHTHIRTHSPTNTHTH